MAGHEAQPPARDTGHCAHHSDPGAAVLPTTPALAQHCCVVTSVSPEPARAPALDSTAKLTLKLAPNTSGLDPPHLPPDTKTWSEQEPTRGLLPPRFLVNSVFLC